jgi:hypothetical protein
MAPFSTLQLALQLAGKFLISKDWPNAAAANNQNIRQLP